jgi:hypothetical protein
MHCLTQGGVERWCWGRGRTLGATVPRLAPLATTFGGWAGGWAWSLPLVVWHLMWAFSFFLCANLHCALSICTF